MTILAALLMGSVAMQQPVADIKLKYEPGITTKMRVGYMPMGIVLKAEKPLGVSIQKEPQYTAAPKYGVLKVGNGPKANHAVAVDEPADGDWRIYIDANANGDLTDDGDGKWSAFRDGDRPMYGVMPVKVRASYGTSSRETGSALYEISFYRFKSKDNQVIQYFRSGAMTAPLTVGGKTYQATVFENDSDGLFDKPMSKPTDAVAVRPVWLMLQDSEKKMLPTIEARAPFELDGKVYEAKITPDGTRLQLFASDKPAYKPPKAPDRPPLLAKGTPAPDFKAYRLDGSEVTLSSFKGKAVVIDFWATWCGPCMVSMPKLEGVWQKIKSRDDVTVLAVCVWDEKAAFEKWVPANSQKFTFPFVFDVAARDSANSIASKLYKVSGIPTQYVVDKDGKVAASFVGASDANETGLKDALKALGIDAE